MLISIHSSGTIIALILAFLTGSRVLRVLKKNIGVEYGFAVVADSRADSPLGFRLVECAMPVFFLCLHSCHRQHRVTNHQ